MDTPFNTTLTNCTDSIKMCGNGCRPDVSVIISAYNERNNIGRAIQSILNQSFKTIEVIVVDDGSTDGTADVVERMSKKDDRIKLLKLYNNQGRDVARMEGVRIFRGNYVTFLDADDTFECQTIERLFNRMVETGSDVVEMGYRHVVNRLPIYINGRIPSLYLKEETYSGDLIDLLLSGKISGSKCNKLYNRRILDNTQLQPQGLALGEDLIFNLNVFNQSIKFAWIDYRGLNYRSADANMCRLKRWDEVKTLCTYLLTLPVVAADENRLTGVAEAMVEDLTENVALRLMNPFNRRKNIRQWIERELVNDFWNKVIPHLKYSRKMIEERDVDSVLIAGRDRLRHNRKNYVLFYLLDWVG